MNQRTNAATIDEKRLLDAKELCGYISMGRNRGVEWARSIGAEVPIGAKRKCYDRKVIDRYLDERAEQAEES